MKDEHLTFETRALLLSLLQETFGSKVELAKYQIVNWREDYQVLLLRLHHPDLAVTIKLAGPKAAYPCPFDRTAMLHQLISTQSKVPVPEVIAMDVSYQKWPWRYLITRYIQGQEWASVWQQLNPLQLAEAYCQIGEAVAQLHTFTFPGFGEIGVSTPEQLNLDFMTALAARTQERVQSYRLRENFLGLLEDKAALFSGVKQGCLTHEDLHGYNILFEQQQERWQLVSVLDFDKAWAGHGEIDLARLELWTGMVGRGFWPAYNAHFSLDSLYEQRRPIYQLLWCFEYAVSTPKHLADTQRLCQQLGLPPIESFD